MPAHTSLPTIFHLTCLSRARCSLSLLEMHFTCFKLSMQHGRTVINKNRLPYAVSRDCHKSILTKPQVWAIFNMFIITVTGGSLQLTSSRSRRVRHIGIRFANWSSTTTCSATQYCQLEANNRFREHRLVHSPFPVSNTYGHVATSAFAI
jgi:hypothetical protein